MRQRIQHRSARILTQRMRCARSVQSVSYGFNLVELMIAMVLGLVILAGVTSLFINNQQTYRTQTALSNAQESGRLAFELMARYIRMAGSTGCPDTGRVVNVLQAGGANDAWWIGPFTSAIQGYSASDALPATTSVKQIPNSDAVVIHGASGSSFAVENDNPKSATLKLNGNPPFKQGQVLIVCDANQASIFQVTNINTNGKDFSLVHNTGNAVSPGNCSKSLGRSDWNPSTSASSSNNGNNGNTANTSCQAPINTTATEPADYTYGADSTVSAYSSTLYFLGSNPDGVPALYQLTQDGSNTSTPQELVDGISRMTLRYGVDNNSDGQVDSYEQASAVTNWNDVLSVQINLLACAPSTRITPVKQKFANVFGQTPVAASDNSLCKPFTGTVFIRSQ